MQINNQVDAQLRAAKSSCRAAITRLHIDWSNRDLWKLSSHHDLYKQRLNIDIPTYDSHEDESEEHIKHLRTVCFLLRRFTFCSSCCDQTRASDSGPAATQHGCKYGQELEPARRAALHPGHTTRRHARPGLRRQNHGALQAQV